MQHYVQQQLIVAFATIPASAPSVLGGLGVEAAAADESAEVVPDAVPVAFGASRGIELRRPDDGPGDRGVYIFGYVLVADGALGH